MGGSGYMGGEALRVLLEHPEVDVNFIRFDSIPVGLFHAVAI